MSSSATENHWPFESYGGSATVNVPSPGLSFAWRPELVERVKRAFELEGLIKAFDEGIDEILFSGSPENPPRTRHRYISALSMLCHFMEAVGFSRIVIGEIVDFTHGLIELDHGTIRHFLRANPSGQKPIDANDLWVTRATISIAVDFLIEEGISRKSACRDIAQSIGVIELIVAKDTRNFASAIERWHRSFKSGAIKSKQALSMFQNRENLIDSYVDQFGLTDRAQAKALAARKQIEFSVFLASWAMTPEMHTELIARLRMVQPRT